MNNDGKALFIGEWVLGWFFFGGGSPRDETLCVCGERVESYTQNTE